MDTPFPSLSAAEFDALVLQQAEADAARGTRTNAPIASEVAPSASSASDQMPSVSVNLMQGLAWSLELAPQVMTQLISRALQSMDRRLLSVAGEEHQLYEQAASALEAERERWGKQFAPLLRVAMAYPLPAKMASILPHVDLRICAAEVAQVDVLVSAQGSRRGNPLGPSAYVQALLELVMRSEAQPKQRQIWADHLLAALSSQLAWVYLQLQAVLRDPSSREASSQAQAAGFDELAAIVFGFVQSDASAPVGDDETGLDTQTQQLAEQARRTVLRLRKHLGAPDEHQDALAQALSGNPMDALLRDLDESERLMAQIHERGLPMPSLDDSGGAFQTSTQTQRLEMPPVAAPLPMREVSIAQITEMLKTHQNLTSPSLARVPVPLREALDDLKVSLLSLAQEDAGMLTDDQHPVQKFLSLITERSLRYPSEMAEGYLAFFTPVDKLITAFAAMSEPSARGFEQACTSLVSVWQRQDEAAAQDEVRKAQQLEQMQAVRQLAGRLGFQLVGRRDAGDAPPMIKQFLMGSWAQVLAKAQLFPIESNDSARYTQALAALLWSVSLRRAAPRKSEHAALVTQLMPQLKTGLQSIQMPDAQADGLLADIRKLQEAVQASAVATDADTSVSDPAPLLAAP